MSEAHRAAWNRVSTVTVTHHSAAVIAGCMRSVAEAGQVIVVDNASDDDTRQIVQSILPSVQLVHNPIGRGFGNACNQGMHRVEREFALLLGPDSTIDAESVRLLVEAADQYPEAGMLGPSIIAPDGHVELSHDWGLFQRMYGGKRTDSHLIPDGPLCADHLSGAVLLIRMSALKQVGGFDPNIFLYYEDDDLCLRMTAGGWRLILVPQARATHVGGGSSRPSVQHRWEKFWHMAWSRLYIQQKYHGAGSAWAEAMRVLPRSAAKAVGYALIGKKWKAIRDAARFAGTVSYLLGRKAMPNLS